MKLAFFQGCNIPIRIEQYAVSATAVLERLGVQLEVIDEFTCCGYPVRNVDEKAYIIPSVRNLAIAEKRGQDIMVICNCCFASLQKAKNVMAANQALAAEINGLLAKDGLTYSGRTAVKHFLTVLHEDIGLDSIKKQLGKVVSDLNLSVIHGCHVLRPREVTKFDDSFVPRFTDELLALTGAVSLDWRGKLECCGAALAGLNSELSEALLNEKVDGALAAGAEFIMPVCSYCHLQFDTTQPAIRQPGSGQQVLPVLLLPQLLGLCMGIDEKILGLEQNTTFQPTHLEQLLPRLGPPVEKKKKKQKQKAQA
jgi:heterodisulfide reductase subunit B